MNQKLFYLEEDINDEMSHTYMQIKSMDKIKENYQRSCLKLKF